MTIYDTPSRTIVKCEGLMRFLGLLAIGVRLCSKKWTSVILPSIPSFTGDGAHASLPSITPNLMLLGMSALLNWCGPEKRAMQQLCHIALEVV